MSVIERLSLTFPQVQIKPTLILIYKNTVWTQLWSAVVSHFQELWWLVWSPGHAEEGPHAQPLSPGLVHRLYAARTREGACQVSCQSDKQKIKWTVLCCEPAKMGRHEAGTAENRSGSTTTLRLFLTRKNGKPSSFTADPNSSRSESYTNLGWGCITNDPDRLGTAIDSDQRRKRPFLSSQFRDIFTVLHNDLLLQEIQIRINNNK